MYLNNGIHEAGIAQVAETTDTRLRLLTQPAVGVGARSPTEVVPGVSRNFEKISTKTTTKTTATG